MTVVHNEENELIPTRTDTGVGEFVLIIEN